MTKNHINLGIEYVLAYTAKCWNKTSKLYLD